MKRISIILIAILFATQLFAQDKLLTIKQAVSGQWRDLAVDDLSGISAFGDNDFVYIKDYSEVMKFNVKDKKETLITSLEDINKILAKAGIEKMSYIPYWNAKWMRNGIIHYLAGQNYIGFNVNTKKLEFNISIPKNAENLRFCKENKKLAYTIDNNLYFADTQLKQTAITDDKDKGIVNGNGYTHRQEFGIDHGIFWSPNGKNIAFYRKDETMVADYPIVNTSTRIAEVNNIKYPMIGEKSEEVTLGIYNLDSKKTIFLKITDFTAERYLTSITWGQSSKYIYVGVLNREQNHVKYNKYDAETGKFVKTLFEEKHPKYVEPENPLIFLKNTPENFLVYSKRDNFKHLYLYNTEGKMLKQITSGKWVVLDFLGFDTKEKNIFITATKDGADQVHLYKVNMKSGKIIKLTSVKGTHSITLSNSKKIFVDKFSSRKIPNVINILDTKKGKITKAVLTSVNPLADYKLGKVTAGTIKSADGVTDLNYRLITPPNFDPKKKYPTIVYVYGGPHAQLVTDSWCDGGLWKQYMAQKGYVMFTVDNRGSANRGLEFENIIHRQCGVEETKDQMEGVKFLKSLPYVDTSRIGVHGWSYGGFMTTTLMTDHAETFKVGVAGGPVIDWKYYEVMYGERYMDTPKENPEGFEKTSLLNKAGKLKGRLLMIHGQVDPVVVPQNSFDFVRACIKAGTDLDYFPYPDSEHNMRGETRVHLMKKVTRYFDDFL